MAYTPPRRVEHPLLRRGGYIFPMRPPPTDEPPPPDSGARVMDSRGDEDALAAAPGTAARVHAAAAATTDPRGAVPPAAMGAGLPRAPQLRASILAAHVLYTAAYGIGQGVLTMLPVLARRRFDAGDWQTLLITAAVPTLLTASIFWNELLQRRAPARFFLWYWLVGVFPLGLATWATGFWSLWVLHLIAAVGNSGWLPLSGLLLKRFYPDSVRGRVFSLLSVVTLTAALGAGLAAGHWLEQDPDAFRIYMPIAAAAQFAGMLVLIRAAGLAHVPAARAAASLRDSLTAVTAPLRSMGRVLREDPRFRQYEQAFMMYGLGWMICNALLPVLATTRLSLTYGEYAGSTLVMQNLAMIVMALPMGGLLDRLGAVRTAALAFAMLSAYPLMLLAAAGTTSLSIASVAFGAAMAGVHVAWMLGPVAFAPRAELVPHYVSIHTTLVGLRGVVAQGLGMALYVATGGFLWPFVLAAAAFAWSAWEMWRLHAGGDARKAS
ncbi:MAG: MFS transporter [Phycisphaerales bacterium]|nr:MFS transporter [Phycisphaerales bacterium]